MKARNSRSPGIPAIAVEGEKALKMAVAEVVAEHRKSKQPLAVWHEGRAVMMVPGKAALIVREDQAQYRVKRKTK